MHLPPPGSLTQNPPAAGYIACSPITHSLKEPPRLFLKPSVDYPTYQRQFYDVVSARHMNVAIFRPLAYSVWTLFHIHPQISSNRGPILVLNDEVSLERERLLGEGNQRRAGQHNYQQSGPTLLYDVHR